MTQDEIDFEEVILAYLRSSKKIKLAKLDVKPGEDTDMYIAQFSVEKGFPGNLSTSLNNPFQSLLPEDQ